MLNRSDPALFDAAISSDDVRTDMERIFGQGTRSAIGRDPIVPLVGRDTVAVPRRSGSGRLWLVAGALVAGGLAWVALPGGNIRRDPLRPATPQLIATAPQPAPPIAAMAMAPAMPIASPEPKPVVTPASEIAPSPRVAREPAIRATAKRTAPVRLARASMTKLRDTCGSLDHVSRAWCMRPRVMNADRELRSAYNDAVRNGVNRRTLIAYRERWSRLRRQATRDPAHVTASYRQMTRDLQASRADAMGLE